MVILNLGRSPLAGIQRFPDWQDTSTEKQAQRISWRAAFFLACRLIEINLSFLRAGPASGLADRHDRCGNSLLGEGHRALAHVE
jgi:hypothetical protein